MDEHISGLLGDRGAWTRRDERRRSHIRRPAFARHDIHDRAAGDEHVEGRISACGGNCARPQAGVIKVGGLLQVLHLAAPWRAHPAECPRTRSASTVEP